MSTTNAANPSSAGTLSPSASNANTTTIASATATATSVAPSSSTIPTVALLFQLNNLYKRIMDRECTNPKVQNIENHVFEV